MPAPLLGDLAQGRDNNFRVMRFLAASAVIISHGEIVTRGDANLSTDWLDRLFGYSLGELAVNVFFVTSGFLVARSLLQRRDVVDYVLSRVLRITPALAVSVLLAAFVLGPLVTDLPLATYFGTRSLYSYVVIDSLSISPLHQRYALPGVFGDLPYPNVVNAPLWSLPWEIWMYVVLLGLFLLRLLGRAFPVLLALVLVAYAVVTSGWMTMDDYSFPALALRFLALFFCGAALVIHGHRLPLSWLLLAAITMAELALTWATGSRALFPLWLAYAVIFLAYHPAVVVRRLGHGPDYSYGLYIYGYMVQQLLVWQWGPHDPLLNGVAALLLSLPLAMASWHLIEEPALLLKQRLRQKRHLPAPDEALG